MRFSTIYPMTTFLKSNRFYSTEKISKRPAFIHPVFQLFLNEDPGVDSVPASDMAPIVAMIVSKLILQTLRDTNLALVNVIF